MKKFYAFTILVFAFSFFANAQTIEDLNKLSNNVEKCTSTEGSNMISCLREYQVNIDLLLNRTYKKSLPLIFATEKTKYINEQKVWVKKKINYFNKLERNHNVMLGSRDYILDAQNIFLETRAKILINKYQKYLLNKLEYDMSH